MKNNGKARNPRRFSPSMLVVEVGEGGVALSGLDTDSVLPSFGNAKRWSGACALGGRVYAAPFAAPPLLAVDVRTGVVPL